MSEDKHCLRARSSMTILSPTISVTMAQILQNFTSVEIFFFKSSVYRMKKPKLTDLREGKEFVRFLDRMCTEGRGLGQEYKKWTNEGLAAAVSAVSVRGNARTTFQKISRWRNGRSLPLPPAFGALCKVFWPLTDKNRSAELEEFKGLYNAARTAWSLRKKIPPPPEITAWEFFVMCSREDCTLLSTEERNIEEQDLILVETGESLFISPSAELKDLCEKNPTWQYAFRSDRSFQENPDFDLLTDETGERRLPEWVERYREETSREIIARFRNPAHIHKPYNRVQFGVRSMHFGVAHEGQERSTVNIRLFRTDFFTNRVMRNIYHKELQHDPRFAQLDEIPYFAGKNFSCLFTSLGVNCEIILRSKSEGEQLVFNKSALLANENQAYRWHLGMNEGVNLDDILDGPQKVVSVRNTVTRGLKEELGYARGDECQIEYFSVFVTRANMEVGIHAAVTLDCTFSKLMDIRAMYARDDRRESKAMEAIPFTSLAIKEFAAKVAKGHFVTYTPLLLDELMQKKL